jgi:RNA polymerase sigma-70 factor (ECF subfamily)
MGGSGEKGLPPCDGRRRDAFEAVVKQHQRSIYYLALRLIRDEQAAADVAQTTFLRAYHAYSRFRGDANVKTWLYRITVNLCRNYRRDQGRHRTEPLANHDPPGTSDPFGELADNEEQARLRRAMATLPERQRMTVMLKIHEGLKYREIAKVLGCSVGTVKAHFHHALTNLKRTLGGTNNEVS